jgi:hypothetical protein
MKKIYITRNKCHSNIHSLEEQLPYMYLKHIYNVNIIYSSRCVQRHKCNFDYNLQKYMH